MKRTLVTGATGFVGANLARRLLRDGHEVHLLVRAAHRPWRIDEIRDDVRLHSVDFEDVERLRAVVDEVRPDWVFHLAAHGAYSYQTDVASIIQTNIVGTVNLVEACLRAGFEVFVNTGSSSEYGFKDHPPTETEWLDPNSHYAVAKASATLYCRYTAESRRVRIPTLRLYSVYGPYEEPTRLIPTLVLRGLAGELPDLVDPDVARDYVYVDDVTDACVLAAARPGRDFGAVYNLGTGVQTSLREVVDVARRAFDLAVEPRWGSMPNRGWDTNVWVSDSRKIRAELGWRPRYAFEDGFRATAAWFRADPGRPALYRRLGGRTG